MKKLEEQIEKIKKDSEGMALDYSAEKERMETKLKGVEREAEKERVGRGRVPSTIDRHHSPFSCHGQPTGVGTRDRGATGSTG